LKFVQIIHEIDFTVFLGGAICIRFSWEFLGMFWWNDRSCWEILPSTKWYLQYNAACGQFAATYFAHIFLFYFL